MEIAMASGMSERQVDVLKFSLLAMCDIVRAGGASVMIAEGDKLVIKAVAGDPGEGIEKKLGISLNVGERVAGKAASTGETIVIIGDVNKDARFGELKKYQEIASGLACPIMKDGKCLGVINLKRTVVRDPLSNFDVDIVKTFAHHMGSFL